MKACGSLSTPPPPVAGLAAIAAMSVGMATACANQGAPPGGPVDVRPPVVVRTEPDTFATITDLGDRVVFHFDERISESVRGGALDDAVTVSPTSGEVHVGHGRTTLSVEVEGGFRPGLLYRVTLQPVVSDMFGNQLRDPFELVFSTGGTAPPSAVAGQAWNRTTGAPLSGALVIAVSPDSLTYLARTDQEGIYVLRYLPEGPYRITAFEDVDRDRVLDARETQGTVEASVSANDTLLVDVGVLPSDTTAARLLTASALDSVTVVLEFDDYLDPDVPVGDIGVTILRPDSSTLEVTRLYHERDYVAFVEAAVDSLLRLDSIDAAARAAAPPADSASTPADTASTPADSAVSDSLPPAVVPPDAARGGVAVPTRPGPTALSGVLTTRGGGGGPARPFPARRLVAVLTSPLEESAEHEARVSGVLNINGVRDGGGETTLVRRPPPAAPEANAPGAAGSPGAAAGAAPDGAR